MAPSCCLEEENENSFLGDTFKSPKDSSLKGTKEYELIFKKMRNQNAMNMLVEIIYSKSLKQVSHISKGIKQSIRKMIKRQRTIKFSRCFRKGAHRASPNKRNNIINFAG